MLIQASRVNEILMDCLFKDEEIVDGKPVVEPILVEGVVRRLGFHPKRVELYREEIERMIDSLPEDFKKGMSFLNLGVDKEGNHWSMLHATYDELLALGLAIEKLEYTLPRSMWSILPSGLPYVVVKTD